MKPPLGAASLFLEAKGYRTLFFQRNRGAAIAAERCHPLQIAIRARHGHYRTIAINRMPGGGEVPAAAFRMLRDLRGRFV